ncbi:hypothetical protein D8911_10765 [Levilactobacillus brevis]|nr:hypothetical protein D8911_10765 [Levilactobacillus brevis]
MDVDGVQWPFDQDVGENVTVLTTWDKSLRPLCLRISGVETWAKRQLVSLKTDKQTKGCKYKNI